MNDVKMLVIGPSDSVGYDEKNGNKTQTFLKVETTREKLENRKSS
jgi:hypothetical protein